MLAAEVVPWGTGCQGALAVPHCWMCLFSALSESWGLGVAVPGVFHTLASVCPSSLEHMSTGEREDASEELLKWSCELCSKHSLMPLSPYVVAGKGQ